MDRLLNHVSKPNQHRRSRAWSQASSSRQSIHTHHHHRITLLFPLLARRRWRYFFFVASVVFFLAIFSIFHREALEFKSPIPLPSLPPLLTYKQPCPVPQRPGLVAKHHDTLPEVVNGPPTERFRDSLRNDTNYITSWSNAGFTNQFMNYVNMIYLGTLSDRVPIIPPFAPDHHISSSAGIIPFGDLFDLDHLRRQLRLPILEWRDVKDVPSRYSADPYNPTRVEPLGCWTTRKESEGEPIRAENVVHHLGVDVSYTRVPTYTRLQPSNHDEPHVVFSQLAALVFPRDPIASPNSFRHLAPSPLGHVLPPEVHLSCFDTMYYVTSGAEYYEWRFSWSPVWRTVGRHLHFTREMKDIGREYLSRLFWLQDGEDIPPFIVVHIRRGDFAAICSEKGEDCFPPLSAYQDAVDKIKQELIEKRGLPVMNVVVASDENSPAFWDSVRNQGWYYINHAHEQTFERFGEWYPPLVDIVIQSFAVGFVGTEDSTFSLVGQRRVQDWNDGLVRNVNVRNGY